MWEDLDYVDDETNARRRAVSGSHCQPGGSELTEEIAAVIRGASAPGMTPSAGARRLPYRCEPYGRVLDVFIPAAWVRPISRDESAWVDVYDLRGE